MYREYWNLKRLHNLNSLYGELGDEGTRDFLKVFKRSKKEGLTPEQMVKLCYMADENNPYGLSFLEKRRKWLIDKVRELGI
jgi:hypothetical protein